MNTLIAASDGGAAEATACFACTLAVVLIFGMLAHITIRNNRYRR